MSQTVRELPAVDPARRWIVRARRHVEGGPAAMTLQYRPDGLVGLLVDGEGRGGALLDERGLVSLERAVRGLLGRSDEAPVRRRPRRPASAPASSPRLLPAREGRGPTRIGGRIVMSVEVHVLLCGFVPAMELMASDAVIGCAGCGCAVWSGEDGPDDDEPITVTPVPA